MQSVKAFLVTMLCILVQCSVAFEFPKDLVRCRPADTDCLLKQFNEVVRKHPHGYPELFLQDFDPLSIGDFKISGDPKSQVNLNMEMKDVKLHGYSNFRYTKISEFPKDPREGKVDFESLHPELMIMGKYKASGKILILPISGEGDFVVKIKNLQSRIQIKPAVEVRDGKTYVKQDVYKLKTKPEGMTIQLDNLFNNEKDLADSVIKVINDNWQLMWDEIEPEFKKQIVEANKKIIDGVMNKIPYDELFIID